MWGFMSECRRRKSSSIPVWSTTTLSRSATARGRFFFINPEQEGRPGAGTTGAEAPSPLKARGSSPVDRPVSLIDPLMESPLKVSRQSSTYIVCTKWPVFPKFSWWPVSGRNLADLERIFGCLSRERAARVRVRGNQGSPYGAVTIRVKSS